MRKFAFVCLSFISLSGFAQTATNFNVNDCSGANHDLFSELNAGKVVVISWVMPCASCIGPSLSAYNEVQTWASSHPGRVVFYIADDVANTSCATLTTWANTNGMSGVPVFSNTAIDMSDYGSAGMPKIVVIGGASHTVLFNQNNSINVSDFNNAINQGLISGINEISKADFNLTLFPNPSASNKVTIKYILKDPADVTVEIFNTLGEIVKQEKTAKQSEGKHQSVIDTETLSEGIYFVKLKAGTASQVLKFTVSH